MTPQAFCEPCMRGWAHEEIKGRMANQLDKCAVTFVQSCGNNDFGARGFLVWTCECQCVKGEKATA